MAVLLTKEDRILLTQIIEMLQLKLEIKNKTRTWKKLRKDIFNKCGAWTTEQAQEHLNKLIKGDK